LVRLPVRPAWLGVILVGGMVGTAVRSALEAAFAPVPGQWPWTTFWINLAGALLLGALLEGLSIAGPDRGWRRGLRLGLGTGMLGGFTTYSTFAVESFGLIGSPAWLIGLGYAVGSVALGVVAAFAGVRAVRLPVRWYRRRVGR
jgi:Integral membrane protein possibly involved in chromosome condensation